MFQVSDAVLQADVGSVLVRLDGNSLNNGDGDERSLVDNQAEI